MQPTLTLALITLLTFLAWLTSTIDAPARLLLTPSDGALIQTFDFDDDSDIDVVLGDETITLHYEEDLDGLATVSTDRIGVPIGGQVHVTVSDFRLNLDPTGEDAWIMMPTALWHHSCWHETDDDDRQLARH